MTSSPDDVLRLLRDSHERLAAAVGPLDETDLERPAYPSEWSIAQVLSHLGSGAEISLLRLEAGLSGQAPPGQPEVEPIWDRWNARTPSEQASYWGPAGLAYLDAAAALSEEQRATVKVELWGSERDLLGLLLLRLNEQIVHAWDVHVALDPAAELEPAALPLVLDGLGAAAHTGPKVETAQRILVSTEGPERHFLLTIGPDGPASLVPATEEQLAEVKPYLRLPAGALIRLVYGRLDPDHTPPVETEGVSLDLLRSVFRGF